jgi:hypothetical protein
MISAIKALVRSDPKQAAANIFAALESHEGNRRHAAKALDVSKVTFTWCVDALGIREDINQRWPKRVRGGGVQSDEHKVKLAENAAARWENSAKTSASKKKEKK